MKGSGFWISEGLRDPAKQLFILDPTLDFIARLVGDREVRL